MGYNMNMAWSNAIMGDAEYIAAVNRVLLPVAYEVYSSGCVLVRGSGLGGSIPHLSVPTCRHCALHTKVDRKGLDCESVCVRIVNCSQVLSSLSILQ